MMRGGTARAAALVSYVLDTLILLNTYYLIYLLSNINVTHNPNTPRIL